MLQILEKDNKEVVKSEKEESDTAIFETLCFEKYKVEEIQVLNKHLIERKVFSSTKNKNKKRMEYSKNDTILLVVTLVLLSTKEGKIYRLYKY